MALNAAEQQVLAELRQGYGNAGAVTVEDGEWCFYPSAGPSRAPITAGSGRELQRKLRRKQGFHIGPRDGSDDLAST